MKGRQKVVLIAVLVLIAGTAGALAWLRTHQRLGKPGIKAEPLPGSVVMNIGLPERVLNFTSTNVPQSKEVLGYLPKDTSYAQRYYDAPDGFLGVNANIILMGADRTSIHRPEYCVLGHGWRIDKKTKINLSIEGPRPYQLEVMRWDITTMAETPDGRKQELHGLYVFWFVADDETVTHNIPLQLYLMRDLLLTGVMQRWAYVSYSTYCPPGYEDATFERMKKLIAASVPEFQLPPRSAGAAVAARE